MSALLLGVHWCCFEDHSGCCDAFRFDLISCMLGDFAHQGHLGGLTLVHGDQEQWGDAGKVTFIWAAPGGDCCTFECYNHESWCCLLVLSTWCPSDSLEPRCYFRVSHLGNPDLWGICSHIGYIVCYILNVQLEEDARVQAVNRNFCLDWFNHLTLILFEVIFSPILVWC